MERASGENKIDLNVLKRFINVYVFAGLIALLLCGYLVFKYFSEIVTSVGSFSPHNDFLTDAVTIYVTIISFAIPLTFEIVSRVSERFKSDVVYNIFLQEKIITVMVISLIINVFLIILLKFVGYDDDSVSGKLITCGLFIGFVMNICLLIRYFALLKKYTQNTTSLKQKLLETANEIING